MTANDHKIVFTEQEWWQIETRAAKLGFDDPATYLRALIDADQKDMSSNYYDVQGQDFFARTSTLDITPTYEAFLAYIPAGGRILDAGCGSGRDTKYFAERGYTVTAIDASPTMVRLAEEFAGQPVQQMRFEDIPYKDAFDGIWTSASLLHVPRKNLDDVFERLLAALKVGGHWYMSFKKGQGERIAEDGRLFLDFELDALTQFAEGFAGVQVVQAWKNADTRPDYSMTWVNVIVSKRQV